MSDRPKISEPANFAVRTRDYKQEFWDLLFPHSEQNYVDNKWELWQEGKMEFLWSCSLDKVKILAQYIDDCKGN